LAIGLSLSGPRQAQTLERALAARIDGMRIFDTVQATWNVLEPSAGAALRAAHDAGVGVIVSLFKRAKAYGGELKIQGLRDQPLTIFRLLRLDRVFSIS